MSLDSKLICFIICTNDIQMYEECAAYINRLIVPDGFEIDIISIEDADSICSAYNAGMQASNARYKVYLHHDAYIINQNFITDMLACFDRHKDAGMIGMIGRKFLPKADYLFGGEQYGHLYETRLDETVEYFTYTKDNCDEKVMHIDGLLMATCVDLPWREDIFDGWDLYDTSQSMEMIRAGFSIYVPFMEIPWCIHECGFLNTSDYARQKKKFIAEYREFEFKEI